ncbi:hypothetical protein GGF31_003756 [Allomyces arbusculus]|nr:hypothetical protein GGF31_003756 [Allomyces arbusculus]
MEPWPNKFESNGHADEPLSTLDAILERSEKRAKKIEKQYHLECGTPKDEDGDEIMPKGQY